MIDVKVTVQLDLKPVDKAVQKAKFENFRHAAQSISKDVKGTLVKSDGPSAPGSPPHTHKRVFLRRAIAYRYDKEGAVIGPRASIVGQAGAAHEFGGNYKGTNYPERPFMQPALDRATPRFAGNWAGSVGQ
jgi:phage gpG-like protein